jgi:uncharacterized membrane protein YfcA
MPYYLKMILAPLTLGILVLFSFFTSALSAATGMGGGVLLFTIMTFYMPIQVIIPIHGIIQFFNNFLTLSFLRTHLKRSLILPFLLGSIPGIILAAFLLNKIIKTNAPQIIILLLIAYSLFRPKRLPDLELKHKNFLWVGLITGFLGIIAGAIDPVLAPFFVRKDLTKEEIIANKAAMQAIVHFAKIPVFLSLGFNYVPFLTFCLITNVACLFGTRFGIIMLRKMSETVFLKVFKVALSVTGLRLVYKLFY